MMGTEDKGKRAEMAADKHGGGDAGQRGTAATEIREYGYGGRGETGRAAEEMRDDGDSSFGDDQLRWA